MPPFLASHGSVPACPEVARPRETEGRGRAADCHSSPTYLLRGVIPAPSLFLGLREEGQPQAQSQQQKHGEDCARYSSGTGREFSGC